jgi:hypothetical protein
VHTMFGSLLPLSLSTSPASFMEGILPSTSVFQGGDSLCFFQFVLFSWIEETHVSLERTLFLVEEGACSTLFPCEYWVGFWMKYILQLRCFKVETGSLCSK